MSFGIIIILPVCFHRFIHSALKSLACRTWYVVTYHIHNAFWRIANLFFTKFDYARHFN